MELAPKLRRQWKSLANPTEKETKKGSVTIMSVKDLEDICPEVEAWHKGKNLGKAYIDGGAQVSAITHACVEQFGLKIVGNSGFHIRMANHQKIKCLGVVEDLEIEVFDVKALVNFHVMPAGLGAYPIILGRPWLRAVGAVQDWEKGIITLSKKKWGKKKFDMGNQQPVDDESESEEEESTESTTSEDVSDTSTESEGAADVSYLLLEEKASEGIIGANQAEKEEGAMGSYEQIEELMQPKMEPCLKQEIIENMLCPDLTSKEKEEYSAMLSQFPNLFITSYEEIRGFKGEDLHIKLKDGCPPKVKKNGC